MKVVALGFDALDPRLVRTWMDQGLLPHFKALAAEGGFSALRTTIPCQSPVAWRSFATGANPGRHGVFDFLAREPGSYLPTMALTARSSDAAATTALGVACAGALGVGAAAAALAATRGAWSRRALLAALLGGSATALGLGAWEGWLPRRAPAAVNRTSGEPFWAALGQAGLRTTALWVPAEFPARAYPHASVLSGLGVPDARGTMGTFTVF